MSALPRVAWQKDAPSVSVESLSERETPIRRYFSSPEVQYVGSTSGCGCDFPNLMLQNGEWPKMNIPESEKTESERAQDISDQHNRELLVNLLRVHGNNSIELYGFWDGSSEAIANSPLAIEDISLDRILESDFHFKEQVLYKVQTVE
jgi:hypothetical protein